MTTSDNLTLDDLEISLTKTKNQKRKYSDIAEIENISNKLSNIHMSEMSNNLSDSSYNLQNMKKPSYDLANLSEPTYDFIKFDFNENPFDIKLNASYNIRSHINKSNIKSNDFKKRKIIRIDQTDKKNLTLSTLFIDMDKIGQSKTFEPLRMNLPFPLNTNLPLPLRMNLPFPLNTNLPSDNIVQINRQEINTFINILDDLKKRLDSFETNILDKLKVSETKLNTIDRKLDIVTKEGYYLYKPFSKECSYIN